MIYTKKNRVHKYIIRYRMCVGIGLNQFFPEFFDIFRDTRKVKITNTIAGTVSPQQFKKAHSYKPKKK